MTKLISALLFFTSLQSFASSPIIWGPAKAQILPAQLCFADATCMSTAGGGGGVAWGAITGTLSSQTDLNSALAGKEPTLAGAVGTNRLWLKDPSDATKLFKWDLSGETTASTMTVTPQNTSSMVLHVPQVATASGAGMALVQDETTGFIFGSGITSSIGAANSMMQLANATTANRAQIKLHSYFNGASVAGVSTLTSRSGVIGTNAAVVAGQDYSKWTAQASATTPGSSPISGTFSFKAATVNSLTVTSDYHLQLTNLAGTLGDRLYLTSEGLLQLPGYSTGIAHLDSSGNVTSSAINLASGDTTVQASKLFYVDSNRSDTYTADGSVSKPFKTITLALAQIITNNDGAQYTLFLSPGNYPESINLNNAAFTRIAIVAASNTDGMMSNDAIPITSLGGDIVSTSSNDNLKALIIRGLDIQGNINMVGASAGSTFCQYGCMFSNLILYSTAAAAVTVQNAGQVIWDNNGAIIQSGAGAVNIQNVTFFGIYHSFLNLGALSIVTNNGANKPSGFVSTGVQTSFGNLGSAVTIDAGSALVQRYERVANTINNSGTLTSISSSYSAVVTNQSGSTWSSTGDNVSALPVLLAGFVGKSYRFDKGYYLNGATADTNVTLGVKDGHIRLTQTTAPTAAPTANAGTGATCTVSNATDLAGTINLTTTVTAPASGDQCDVTFNKAYNVAPICLLTPANSNAATLSVSSGVYKTSSTSALSVNFGTTDAIGHSYVWDFHCMETQ